MATESTATITRDFKILFKNKFIEKLPAIIDQVMDEVFQEHEEPTEDLCRILEAMEITGYARQTIYDKIHKGTIPYFKKGGRLFFSRSELRNWIKS